MPVVRRLPRRRSQDHQRLSSSGEICHSHRRPVFWTGGERSEADVLANCYHNSLQLAAEHGLTTIAFPAISCGAYRYPIDQAAQVAVQTTQNFLRENDRLAKVIFVLWDEASYAMYRALLPA